MIQILLSTKALGFTTLYLLIAFMIYRKSDVNSKILNITNLAFFLSLLTSLLTYMYWAFYALHPVDLQERNYYLFWKYLYASQLLLYPTIVSVVARIYHGLKLGKKTV